VCVAGRIRNYVLAPVLRAILVLENRWW